MQEERLGKGIARQMTAVMGDKVCCKLRCNIVYNSPLAQTCYAEGK